MEDNSKNIIFSNLKKSEKKVIVGIDEAGRGPVLGYMVYCVMVFEINNVPSDVKDSKMLSDRSRREIFNKLKGFNFAYKAIHPSYITTKMLSKVNLNDISWQSVVELLNLVNDKFSNIEGVFIDAIGTCDKLKSFLGLHFSHKLYVESKADSKYPVVSAASIVAKVIRDDKLKDFDGSFGSGYPSDPNTKQWLIKNINKVFGWGVGVRYTWGTSKNMLGSNRSRPFLGNLSGFYVHSE